MAIRQPQVAALVPISGREQLRAWLERSLENDAQLAVRLGISRAYMSQIFHGKRRPGLELLLLIAEVTGIQLVAWRDNGIGIQVDMRKRKPISASEPIANSDAA